MTNPSAESPFYDEGDLVEIFDYAGDQNDDATRTEVIAMAARLYPDSDALKVRKAFYYFYIEREDMAQALVEGQHERHPMWDILSLRLDEPEGEELEQRLQLLLTDYPKMDDETLIQLVDAANTLNRLDWVIANIEGLKKKTNYTPTLLYEVAVMSSMAGDSDTVIRLVDELTAIEPFYAPYWIMLARAYGDKEQYDEALNAVDYALAIDGELTEALAVKVQLMLLKEMNVEELLPQLRRKAEEDPSNMMLVRTLGLAEHSVSGSVASNALYEEYLAKNPGARELLQSYLENAESPDPAIINRYFEADAEVTEDEVLQMCQSLAYEGHYTAMSLLLQGYHAHDKLTTGFEMLVIVRYIAGEYAEIERMFDQVDDGIYTPYFSSMVALVYTFALVRQRHKAKAKKFIDSWIARNSKSIFPSPGERVRNTGVRYYMHTLRDSMATITLKELNRLDPILPISGNTPPTF